MKLNNFQLPAFKGKIKPGQLVQRTKEGLNLDKLADKWVRTSGFKPVDNNSFPDDIYIVSDLYTTQTKTKPAKEWALLFNLRTKKFCDKYTSSLKPVTNKKQPGPVKKSGLKANIENAHIES